MAAIRKGDAIYAFGGTRVFFNESTFDRQVIKVDLTSSWNLVNNSNPTFGIGAPNATSAPPSDLTDSAIFYDHNDDFRIYGGSIPSIKPRLNVTPPSLPVGNRIWTLKNTTGSWESITSEINPSQYSLERVVYAAAPEYDLVFFLNGILTDTTHPKMTVYNTRTKLVRTISTDQIAPAASRVGAMLLYLPLLGRQGALVLFGGGTKMSVNTTNYWGVMNSLDTVQIFDIASLNDTTDGIWYTQPTNGRTPPSRHLTCAVPILSPDASNYHIYVSSGRSYSKIYDDIWVLSLPQFHWTQVFEGNRPNYGSTCHLVGEKQLLVLGGVDAVHENCWGTPYITLFDMTNLKWVPTYVVADKDYRVPKTIYELINGSSIGKAMVRKPEGGFAAPGLEQLFDNMQVVGSNIGNSLKSSSLFLLSVAWFWILLLL